MIDSNTDEMNSKTMGSGTQRPFSAWHLLLIEVISFLVLIGLIFVDDHVFALLAMFVIPALAFIFAIVSFINYYKTTKVRWFGMGVLNLAFGIPLALLLYEYMTMSWR